MRGTASSRGFAIRPRNDADMARCIALLRRVHASDGYPSSWPEPAEGWLTPRGMLGAWVAIAAEGIVGHVAVGTVDEATDPYLTQCSRRALEEIGEVKRLFVDPASRREGIAAKLLSAAVEFIRSQRRHPMLEVTGDRAGAIHFYERNGWRRIGSNIATWQRASGERPIIHQYEHKD